MRANFTGNAAQELPGAAGEFAPPTIELAQLRVALGEQTEQARRWKSRAKSKHSKLVRANVELLTIKADAAEIRTRLDWLAKDLIEQARLADYANDKANLRAKAIGVWLALEELWPA